MTEWRLSFRFIKNWLVFAILFFPILSWSAERPPEPIQLLRLVLTPPSQPYQGHLVVTHWSGRDTKSEEIRVQFNPPNKYRWEFLNRDGTTQRVVESDGNNEFVWAPKKGKILRGDAIKSSNKRMPLEDEFKLLLSNYDFSNIVGDDVAGREVWMMELIPKSRGKAHQQLWVDKASGVVLENKKYRPNEGFAVVSRYVRFSTPGKQNIEKRDYTKEKLQEHNLEPDFLSLEDWQQATGRRFFLPQNLPQGFSFESIDFFSSEKDTINHVRYTDGLTVLSIFETSRPVRSKKIKANPNHDGIPTDLSLPETVVHQKINDRYLTLIGDTSEEFLKTLANSLK